MSDELATAQPEAIAPEATAVSSTPEASSIAPEIQSQVDRVKSEAKSHEDTLGDIWDKKFAPKSEAKAPQVSDPPENTAPEPAQSSPAIEAPNSWSADLKAKWNTLPPDVQGYIAQRESEAHKAISQSGNELKAYQPIRQVAEHYRGYYAPGQEAQFFGALAQANAALEHDPVGTLKHLIEHYRVDPAQLTGSRPTQAQAPDSNSVDDLFRDTRLDKEVLPLVQSMAQELRQVKGQLSARQQAEADQRKTEASNAISDFSKDKPDFSELHDDIVREVSMMDHRVPMKERLATAYDRARWANPTHRQRILDDQRKTEAAKAQKELAEKQAAAKKHISANVRTGAAASTLPAGQKWNDETSLSALYDRIASRG
jgi:hypothetical protein